MSDISILKKYQSEILEVLEELDCNAYDSEYVDKVCARINDLIKLIELVDTKVLTGEEFEEIGGFIDYVNDTLKKYKTNEPSEVNPVGVTQNKNP